MAGIIATVIVFGIVIVWVGALLLRVAYPDDPAKGKRPRKSETENLAVRSIAHTARRKAKKGERDSFRS